MIIKDYITSDKALSSQGKIMGIDLGTKRIGIAMTDEARLLTTPKMIIERISNLKDFAKIANLIKENNICAIVIGFPINMDGSFNQMSHFTEKFTLELDSYLQGQVDIYYADERLTSFEAKDMAMGIAARKKQKYYDDIAASIILRDFLDMVKGN